MPSSRVNSEQRTGPSQGSVTLSEDVWAQEVTDDFLRYQAESDVHVNSGLK